MTRLSISPHYKLAVPTLILATLLSLAPHMHTSAQGIWIRTSQIGYLPSATKVAVLMSEAPVEVVEFKVVDVYTGQTVFEGTPGQVRATGPLGQMASTARLDFSALRAEGAYRLEAAGASSEIFPIDRHVFDGRADFVLNYMRQQRCGYNPFIRDSCHTKDGIIVYHPTKSGQYLDVRGGWHDASDCLQYTTTSANAVYQMMFAFEQNPAAFPDNHQADGRPGRNGIPDIVDEIKWGLDWLDRMNPAPGEMYNQLADDRDHEGMRLPSKDKADYGWGSGSYRPVYFCTGEPQQRGKFMNATTGIASTAGKFASCFALGARILKPYYPDFADRIAAKALTAYDAGVRKPGNCQTASVVSPYIYEEDNWTDDMELAAVELFAATSNRKFREDAVGFGRREPVTPWMGADSARHYQWYPFMNMGHYRIAAGGGRQGEEFVRNLRAGIQRTFDKAKDTPFLYGIPSVWCSNNLTTAMLTQCILYRQLTGDRTYEEMEGALRDWLLGCNPWGVCMVVELERGGTYPLQPHSFIINGKLGNTTGGLVDGPVYSTIFSGLIGISTEGGANYDHFQPGNMVYHDSTHDYSTNEPTMDGTACLTFPFSAYEMEGKRYDSPDASVRAHGGIVRTNPDKKTICLVFTAADKHDGTDPILKALKRAGVPGSFFFTGEFFEQFPDDVEHILADGHYVGSHSYGHLLYASWEKRDSLLVDRETFIKDILQSYRTMAKFGIGRKEAPFFMPPYEHYNATIASWARSLGLQVVNYTPGTYTNGDYTTPDMPRYMSTKFILDKVAAFEKNDPHGLAGNIMLIHLGTEESRTDKLYNKLPSFIRDLQRKGYRFTTIEEAIEGDRQGQ